MAQEKAVVLDIEKEVARVTFNKPEKHNAFDERMLEEVTRLFSELGAMREVRAVVLTGNGSSFSAGADLDWMKKVAGYTREQNLEDATKLATMFYTVYSCPKPVIGRINGTALGGGAGLVASCDIAIASEGALFGFPEAKLGIVPAVISPYVIEKIGVAQARALFITGERIDARRAYEIGLVNQVVPKEGLDGAVDKALKLVMSSGPNAAAECKALVNAVSKLEKQDAINVTAEIISRLRATPEGREGMGSFLQKRKPDWNRE
jgi:methylglutaconyl-CoA hydratase